MDGQHLFELLLKCDIFVAAETVNINKSDGNRDGVKCRPM